MGNQNNEARIYINRTKWFLYILILLVLVLYGSSVIEIRSFFSNLVTDEYIVVHRYFDVDTVGCRIPKLDPFDDEVQKYIIEPNQLICTNSTPLITSNVTHLILNMEEFEDAPNCSYQNFWRVEDKPDYDVKYEDKEHFFNSTIEINQEFIRVKCYNETGVFYTDFHSFVPFTEMNVLKDFGSKFNLIVLGLDAISRLNFHRTMPLTYNYLVEKMEAVEFLGYNKVGDNTFPNLVPILAGFSDTEIEKNCWKEKNVFDNCSFIWDNFEKLGYKTAFSEDAAWMAAFKYAKKGFSRQPTTHYWTPFGYTSEREIGSNRLMNADICVGPRFAYQNLLHYVSKYITVYQQLYQNYFGFFWENSLSHDILNLPKLGDQTYVNLLTNLYDSKLLEDTILVVMSDHGIRWGGIRNTHQGQLEERLPMLYITLPKRFKKQYPTALKTLKSNSDKLTTPFDLHETFKAIADHKFITSQVSEPIPRGISLFRPIPDNRTCESATIDDHWCTCHGTEVIDIRNKTIESIVNYIIEQINVKLENYSDCENLSLSKISGASLSRYTDFLKKRTTMNHYTVNFVTRPGAGNFEATIKCTVCDTVKDFYMAGPISRTNLYGQQSYCVNDAKIKLYCYCRK